MVNPDTTPVAKSGQVDGLPRAESAYSRPLQVLLVGRPDSGKSNLLGALSQAAITQQQLLDGTLVSQSEGLLRLQQLTYDGPGQIPTGELAGYEACYLNRDRDWKIPVLLIDCDGNAARNLLETLPHEKSSRGILARTMLQADVLLLLVDASASPDQLNEQYEIFGTFLHALEKGRGKRTDASGLPVFLVLTKCDRLVEPNASYTDWLAVINQRKQEVDSGFRDFLARKGAAEGRIPFGRIDLQIGATAIRKPSLRRLPLRMREPFGVAELFQQVFLMGDAYRMRKVQSRYRVITTTFAALLLAGMMLVGIAFLLSMNRSRAQSPLARKIEFIRSQEADTPTGRLRTSTTALRERREQLELIRKDQEYRELPEEDRRFVESRIREISDYLDYYQNILSLRRPADMTSEKEMQLLRKQLDGDYRLKAEWKETVAGSIHTELSQELTVLQSAVNTLQHWFRDNGDRLRVLWAFEDNRTPGPAWYDEVLETLEETRHLPFSEEGNLPGSRTLTAATALAFLPVVRERDYHDRVRRQLEGERDLLAALGLLGRVTEAPVLVVPRNFRLAEASMIMERLRKNYPNYEKDFELDRLPASIRPNIIQAARSSYQAMIPAGRERVLQQFQQEGTGNQESAERWDKVRGWLVENPPEWNEFRQLASLLGHLHEHAEPVDPVRDLARFLGLKSFEISPAELTLIAPESYGNRLPSNADLSIRLFRGGEEKGNLLYQRNFKRTSRDEETRGYRFIFVLTRGDHLQFLPGDTLRVSLKLKDDEALSWISQRSDLYQFERLSLPPRRARAGMEEEKGEEETRVYLRAAEGTIPRVPDLLPVVK